LCVQLVFDFEETKGMPDYCLGFLMENSKYFQKPSFVVVSFTSRTHVSRAHIILIREDDFDRDDDDASFWERCFCCWSDESEEYYSLY
tara:strand:+ start:1420 stop:1683 length:264 start_codon:yes stop_codon:yes gene_type:complete